MLKLDEFSEKAARISFHSRNVDEFMFNLHDLLSGYMPIGFMKLSSYVETTKQFITISSLEKGILRDTMMITDVPDYISETDIVFTDDDVFYMTYNSSPLPKYYLDFIGLKGNTDLVLQIRGSSKIVGALIIRAFEENAYNDYHKTILQSLLNSVSMFFFSALVCNKLIEDNVRLTEKNHELVEIINDDHESDIIGSGGGLKDVINSAESIARFNSTVLLTGETGVGKDVIANYIHQNSPRKNEPFIKLNCGAIPEALIDNELFGHEKGAFTGADSAKNGRFQIADKGTLFLDEIGELPLSSQVKLLRALQFGEVERLGNGRTMKVDVRVIAATNRDIRAMVADGKFREDLYWRLNVFPIYIPPLRERRKDIPYFINYLIQKKCRQFGVRKLPQIRDSVLEKLVNYEWPGNVREMENIIEREIIINRDGFLTFDCISVNCKSLRVQNDPESFDAAAKMHIESALEATGWRISGAGGAAEKLGINPSTLRNKMKKLGISFK